MSIGRRALIKGLGSLVIAAPAIVRASSLMPVKAWKPVLDPNIITPHQIWYVSDKQCARYRWLTCYSSLPAQWRDMLDAGVFGNFPGAKI